MSILNRTGNKRLTGISSFLVIGTLLLAACGPTATPTTTTSTTSTIVPSTGSTSTAIVGITAEPTISTDSPPTAVATSTSEAMMGETPEAMTTPEAMMTPGGVMGSSYTIQLNAQNGSNQMGAAVIADLGNGKVAVAIDITADGVTDPQPAHIHKGTCSSLDPNPAYPLTNVVNGKSVTEVEANFADLVASPYAINIHKSAAEATTYVSCGDITKDGMMSGTPEAMMTPGAIMEGNSYNVTMNAQNGSNQSGKAVLTDIGNGMVNVVLDITAEGVTDPQPAHIHQGTCAQLDPSPAYPLSNVVNGKSVTEIEADFDTLTATAFAINVHKSAAEATTYVSCGDITTEGMMMGETPTP